MAGSERAGSAWSGRLLANTAAYMGPASLWDGRIAFARENGMQAVAGPTLARWFPPAFHASAPDVVECMRPAILATPVEGYVACCEAIATWING